MSDSDVEKAGAERVARLMSRFGCLPPDAPTGPVVERFDAKAVGMALESEIAKAGTYGFTKITLHMDLPDARELARFLLNARMGT